MSGRVRRGKEVGRIDNRKGREGALNQRSNEGAIGVQELEGTHSNSTVLHMKNGFFIYHRNMW